MERRTMPSSISLEKVAEIQSRLDPLDLYSCIFLLYDSVEQAARCIFQLSSNRSSVIQNASEGPLMVWALRCQWNNDESFKDKLKLIEALTITKNFSVLTDLVSHGHQNYAASNVDRVRKILYLMIDDLTNTEWTQLKHALINEAKDKNLLISEKLCRIPELFLLCLMSDSYNLLKIKEKNENMDFKMLSDCLRQIHKFSWAQQILEIEDTLNKGVKFDLDCNHPGTLLIFDLHDYTRTSHTQRTASNKDCDRLKDTFNLLNFKVMPPYRNPISAFMISEIRRSLKTFCQEAKYSKKERCFAVAILAHGDSNGIHGVDGKYVPYESIRRELRSLDTYGLPRLLITQSCRGDCQVPDPELIMAYRKQLSKDKPKTLWKDGPTDIPKYLPSNLDDMIELYPSVSGFVSYRDPNQGAPFIHSLCKNILTYGREKDLCQLMQDVRKDIRQRTMCNLQGIKVVMTPQLIETMTKLLFLPVPIQNILEKDEFLKRLKQ